jgi:hypothetical protein
MNLPALRTIIDTLLLYPSINRIVTRVNFVTPGDPRVSILEKAGFRRQTDSSDKSAVYYCNPDTFPVFGKNTSLRIPSVVE